MRVKKIAVQDILPRLHLDLQQNDLKRKFPTGALPLRAELFNRRQMEAHGVALAKTHKLLSSKRTPDLLLKRLASNEKTLLDVRLLLVATVKEKQLLSPGGEWLLDNFYLIEEQIRTGKRHLPKGYSESLPNLANGPSAGLPRVYDIAVEIISHSDGRIDMENLCSFIESYQSVTQLKLGELWAIPIMLRLAIIENIRRVAEGIGADRANRDLAGMWAQQMINTAEQDPKSLILTIADMARSNPPVESAFVAELTRQLMWKGPALALPLTWMEQRLSEHGLTSNDLVNQENQKQAADQVSISNSIGSLRFLGGVQWQEFVESMSVVEQTLRKDTNSTYGKMDFASRDRYRHVVEGLAKISPVSEKEIAMLAIALAQEGTTQYGNKDRRSHVGYYLIDDGLAELEIRAGAKHSSTYLLKRTLGQHPLLLYVGSIFLLTILLSGYAFLITLNDGMGTGLLLLFMLISVCAASQLAISLVNWIATLIVKPALLPRMNFSTAIPAEFKTLVVVPTMLTSAGGADQLLDDLEVRYLANRNEHLYFSLLTDFADAAQQTLPGDEPLVAAVHRKIEALNQQYGNGIDRFFLFHRPRLWNAKDKIWMGYERKRGKLADLNRLLQKGVTEPFSHIAGNLENLENIRYVITLDTDTQLPLEAAWKMMGTMAHPLNQAVYSEKKQRIVAGYGILQPRASISIPAARLTWYQRMHGNDPGIDPYTRATSDVYQDLFNEGSFIGKGIYDLAAFELSLHGKFPENRILSHDLLEGCYARAGLLSDIQLYEEFPAHYSADVNRRHRWIRGDWQIGRWLAPRVPDTSGKKIKNHLSILSWWKIFDNLRRSLVPAALTLLLILGWAFTDNPWFWTMVVSAVIVTPTLFSSVWTIAHKPKELTWQMHLNSTFSTLVGMLVQNAFMLACLPYEAFYSCDAILRTTWRMLVSHKKLLEWTPSGHYKKNNDSSLSKAFAAMWISPAIAVATIAYLIMHGCAALYIGAPFMISWIIAPAIAWWMGKPVATKAASLSASHQLYLHKLARKTWRFFERFVTAEDNWLPPDNYQEQPTEVIAHRTSPTNIGLSMLANLTAYDFGYVTAGKLLERTANTLSTLENMERHRGHFYNWYDTTTLAPLWPRYISTVDSGNLAGFLLTLRQGLLHVPSSPIAGPNVFAGMHDTVNVLSDVLASTQHTKSFSIELNKATTANLEPLSAVKASLENLCLAAAQLAAHVQATGNDEAAWWAEALETQCTEALDDLLYTAPWLSLFPGGAVIPAKLEIARLNDIAAIDFDTFSAAYAKSTVSPHSGPPAEQVSDAVEQAIQRARARINSIETMSVQLSDMADMEYDFLYDRSKHLLSIGYNADDQRLDPGMYDLLASEARLATYTGIAQGKLPQDSWFALGRLLTNTGGKPLLLSWSGSMFEYLMPALVMPSYENTLLHQTNKAMVETQIAYGNQKNVPWGISEAGYNMVDANLNYQYRAFGVPGLGLKRGLADDLVIAPYATALSLMVMPEEACANLEIMTEKGFEGRYGFYEAIDYTAGRLQPGQQYSIIRSHMAHHQGMSLLSFAYLLHDKPMQKRFEAELQYQSALLLLQERVPKVSTSFSHTSDVSDIHQAPVNTEMRVLNTPFTAVPEVQLLSNGKYHVMITNSGGGYSRWKDIAVTRWREDATCDNWGTFCYVYDLDNNIFWSNTYQPALRLPKHYEVSFTQGRADFRRGDNNIETYTEVVVSPEDDIEMRRVHVTNRSRRRRSVEVTSYAEVVLAAPAADAMHPAFSNLFVETEILHKRNAIICTRRPRSAGEVMPWMCHLVKAHGAKVEAVSYETDRMKFLGRGNTIHKPVAMTDSVELSDSDGFVLDPIVSVRYKISLEPGQTAIFDMITGVAGTKEECRSLIDKYQDRHHADRVLEMSWAHSQVVLRQINATESDAQLYGRLASSIIYHNPLMRTDPAVMANNHKGQSGLWSYAISGDLPIVLLKIGNTEHINLVKQMVQAHAYWRLKGLAVDLVIWNEDHGGYRQELQDMILSLIAAGVGANFTDKPGGVFLRAGDQVSQEDRTLIETVARVIISDTRGTIADQLNWKGKTKIPLPLFVPVETMAPVVTTTAPASNLLFANGMGGFDPGGQEYIVTPDGNTNTPAPWVNVIANKDFGTVISEGGQAYTWIENAHEQRLTPWNNDPVTDYGGEGYYIRDEESGFFWSPCRLPVTGTSPYITRHGFGYSVFEHSENGIISEMTVFVDLEKTIRYTVLKLRNESGRSRKLSVTGYMEWVLGDLRPRSVMHVVTEPERETNALFARNPYNADFSGKIAFFDVNDPNRLYTADRIEFIGRNGTLSAPKAMTRSRLSNRSGAGLDPCAALQSFIELTDGQEKEIIFRLGAAQSHNEAVEILRTTRGSSAAAIALAQVKAYWNTTIGAVQIETPAPALNILTNGWLIYQALACRLWARSGYYQSGGAFGFRDQLQDVLAIMHTQPAITREQILLCASRQFREGDVQHWWHPPTGRGVRTRCSDDYLWLPYATAQYIVATGDTGILDEQAYYLDGRLLNADEESYYDMPNRSGTRASLYDHCISAVRYGLRFGEHGLPLMGSGDWNDGMDMVGRHGKGESIWLAFFLHDVLRKFAPIARFKEDAAVENECITAAATLKENINKNGWDGQWYRRAYFDDGTPLGTATNAECSIDSISQSWAVLSGAGQPERIRSAMEAVNERLVDRENKLIQLLDPPFDKSDLNPGYIKGYVPGVRENGGQYSHAAIWMVMAFAAMGDNRRTWELLDMINPINHARTPAEVAIYKSEPYVMVADVYKVPNHVGKGGWTWYTGSAGWMYQAIIQSLLGLRKEGNKLIIAPCIPPDWPGYKIRYRFYGSTYHINIVQSPNGETTTAQQHEITLVDDGTDHRLTINLK